MSKWTMFWIGAFISAFMSFGAFRGPDLYHRFSPDGYQTFAVKVPNQFLQNGHISPSEVEGVVYTFSETLIFSMARAIEMKDNSNLKKLDTLLDTFLQYDKKQYQEWREKHPKFF